MKNTEQQPPSIGSVQRNPSSDEIASRHFKTNSCLMLCNVIWANARAAYYSLGVWMTPKRGAARHRALARTHGWLSKYPKLGYRKLKGASENTGSFDNYKAEIGTRSRPAAVHKLLQATSPTLRARSIGRIRTEVTEVTEGTPEPGTLAASLCPVGPKRQVLSCGSGPGWPGSWQLQVKDTPKSLTPCSLLQTVKVDVLLKPMCPVRASKV